MLESTLMAFICGYALAFSFISMKFLQARANSGDWVDQHYNFCSISRNRHGLAKAGTIYDCNGNILVSGDEAEKFIMKPKPPWNLLPFCTGDNSSNISYCFYRADTVPSLSDIILYFGDWNMPDSLRRATLY